jgi:hypothetical protein
MSEAPCHSEPAKDPDLAAATEGAADVAAGVSPADPQSHAGETPATTPVPDAVDRAGDNTPTKPGAEASKASSGLADHTKHPPGERAENAAVAVSGDEEQK